MGLIHQSVDQILHLDQAKLTLYKGGYDSFERQRLEQQTLQLAEVLEGYREFCDFDLAELALIDKRVDYEPRTVTSFTGKPVEALSFNSRCDALGEFIGVHLLINDADDQRGALHLDDQGRKPRGDAAAVRALLVAETGG